MNPTAKLPKEGSSWAVAVFVQSDLRLLGEARPAVVPAGKVVALRAVLTGPSDTTSTKVSAVIRDAGGRVVAGEFLFDDGTHDAFNEWAWTADEDELFSIEVR